ncbi:rod shape-determining protein RodA [Halobacteriovorax marinus]|uniref:Peptidoglycan glycosyltransferase RodA n=1 Tax=Halobacteriovorax marinus (strain ATCC BAA-682 / DSM 15412 / SJ) TaxID=862908 RepID=E1WYP3_HALMS|nr:rod shape-determining protein RodA [Halobacteriovorax marinus]ATH08977.1 rod shape-determining protein RodA [Halobacteriovorax marinus]CBW27683.1 rod shape-determining protein RodA [Halobacteriovorax marinus SJ]
MNTSALIEALKKYDFSFFGICGAIFLMGVVNLYSATHASVSDHMANLYKVQIGWYLVSLLIGVVISFIQPKNFFRFSWLIFAVNIFLLVLVLILGHKGMGAQRWLVIGPIRLQPSEFMKMSSILVLARWYAKRDPDKELGFKQLIIPFLIAFVPTLLIVIQPDLGTGLLILLIFFVISFYRKLKWKTIAILAIIGVISGGVMYQFGLKDYQKRRIVTFLNPAADAKGSGYNAIQSKIAIGSGKVIGKGFRKSSQASLNYLPENHTDFVFSIFNEEHGFVGSLFLITLFIVLFYRFIWLAQSVPRIYESIVIIGIMSIFFWHTFINMGMVAGLMPIVGLPLPLMSYGGSSLMTFGICCGIATSISNSRNLF